MKKAGILILIALFIFSCGSNSGTTDTKLASIDQTEVTDGVFIHITAGYDNPHRVLMPLKMATMMASDKDVLVYLDIDAVNLLVKDAEDLSYEDFESVQTYIKMLSEKGVGVYACPTCLKIAGFQPADLMEGVKVAEKDKFFDFTKGRIITLDY